MKTPYCTGSGRSVPSSFATRAYSLRGASGGSSSGTGSPERRITTNTTVETSHTATRARARRVLRKLTTARMDQPGRGTGPGRWPLGPAKLEREATDLELLVRIQRPLDVLLNPVVLVWLDHRNPREVLEEDLRHLLVRLPAELLVDGEAGRLAELVEARVAPVVLRPARRQEPPEHAVGIAQRGCRIGPPQALER